MTPQHTSEEGQAPARLGLPARALLFVLGTLFVSVPFVLDERLPGDIWSFVFGGLALFAAIVGRDPLATRTSSGER
ncbi:MAG: hypothetical protein AAF389_12540 [Gemmatimonadota bacterium]